MKNIFRIKIFACLILALNFLSCSLDEENPGGFTMEVMASSEEGYETFINQCYFAMERYFYGEPQWLMLSDASSDLWTYKRNLSNTWTEWFWYFSGASPKVTYTNNYWNGTYDGIGACNLAISLAEIPPYKTEEARNAKVAEAYFMRAVYYFNAVEQFGGVRVITAPVATPSFAPEKVDPLTVYKDVIIPDLEFAAKWLPVGDDNTTTRPTKKSALGFLAKACLQTVQYDASKEYVDDALKYAKMLIDDAEGGGSNYNAFMYSSFDQVFAEENNWANKEALWKHRWYGGVLGSGSSKGAHKTNQNYTGFYCDTYIYGARINDVDTRYSWGGQTSGQFMPTQHLLSLFIQTDGTLDPRFHNTFQTEWKSNVTDPYRWDDATIARFDKDSSVKEKMVMNGDVAIKFIMPQVNGYEAEIANKHKSPYLLVDYKDVYDEENKNVKMKYAYKNPSDGYTADGTSENPFTHIYPSLSKHNSSQYYVVNASSARFANLNATFIMRMSEIYLIAAEADIYQNGGSNAMGYINKVRERAGARALTGLADIRTVLDERGRELCGEYTRFYDLKRAGMLKDATYLEKTHPDLAKYFKAAYALRPIPLAYIQVLDGGGKYFQNPGY